MILQKSIIIIGQICSGKSSLAKKIAAANGFIDASFGKYLRHYNHIGSRQELQDIGYEMIKNDHITFLKNVISFATNEPKDILFEGVRHEVIFNEIMAISNSVFSIYLDSPYDLRLARYLKRDKNIDKEKSEAEFHRASLHPVEIEIPLLKSKCTLAIQSTESAQADFSKVQPYIELWLNNF